MDEENQLWPAHGRCASDVSWNRDVIREYHKAHMGIYQIPKSPVYRSESACPTWKVRLAAEPRATLERGVPPALGYLGNIDGSIANRSSSQSCCTFTGAGSGALCRSAGQ